MGFFFRTTPPATELGLSSGAPSSRSPAQGFSVPRFDLPLLPVPRPRLQCSTVRSPRYVQFYHYVRERDPRMVRTCTPTPHSEDKVSAREILSSPTWSDDKQVALGRVLECLEVVLTVNSVELRGTPANPPVVSVFGCRQFWGAGAFWEQAFFSVQAFFSEQSCGSLALSGARPGRAREPGGGGGPRPSASEGWHGACRGGGGGQPEVSTLGPGTGQGGGKGLAHLGGPRPPAIALGPLPR